MTPQEINAVLQQVTNMEELAKFFTAFLQAVDWNKELDHNQIHAIKCGTMDYINMFPLKEEETTPAPKEGRRKN